MASTTPNPIGDLSPVMTVTTDNYNAPPAEPSTGNENSLYADGVPVPHGSDATVALEASNPQANDPAAGTGTEGEVVVWEERYSRLNFVGRIFWRVLATLALFPLAHYTVGLNGSQYSVPTKIWFLIVAALWIQLVFRMVQAHFSHFYQMTNRRLFVSTGVIKRRRDMMELLRVKDIFIDQQNLLSRTLGIGTVVVVPTEHGLPTFYLLGVRDPVKVMDLIWNQARAERDLRSVKVDSV